MSLPNLQRLGDSQVDRDIFAFEHAMAHRELLSVMAPLSRFGAYPYMRMLDPLVELAVMAGDWHFNHQQAHNDAMGAVPTYYGAKGTGLFIGGNLIDYNLDDQEQRQWWLHRNHFEHMVMSNSVMPFPGAPPPEPTQPPPPAPPIPWPPQWWTNQSGRYTFPFW